MSYQSVGGGGKPQRTCWMIRGGVHQGDSKAEEGPRIVVVGWQLMRNRWEPILKVGWPGRGETFEKGSQRAL